MNRDEEVIAIYNKYGCPQRILSSVSHGRVFESAIDILHVLTWHFVSIIQIIQHWAYNNQCLVPP